MMGKPDIDLLLFVFQWGPGIIILTGLYLLFIKILRAVPTFISQHAENINAQTAVLSELKDSLSDSQQKHSLEHREMLLTLRYVAQKLESLDERIRSTEK